MDDKLDELSLIHDAIASAGEIIDAMDVLLKAPDKEFVIPRKTLEEIQNILKANVVITSRLVEDNLKVNDLVVQILTNLGESSSQKLHAL
jgi:DNA polymerase III sliding clamp (beta) subunit (PCNA family)